MRYYHLIPRPELQHTPKGAQDTSHRVPQRTPDRSPTGPDRPNNKPPAGPLTGARPPNNKPRPAARPHPDQPCNKPPRPPNQIPRPAHRDSRRGIWGILFGYTPWDNGIPQAKGEPIMLQLPVSLGKPGGVCFARCGCFSFAPGRAGLRADGLRGGGLGRHFPRCSAGSGVASGAVACAGSSHSCFPSTRLNSAVGCVVEGGRCTRRKRPLMEASL